MRRSVSMYRVLSTLTHNRLLQIESELSNLNSRFDRLEELLSNCNELSSKIDAANVKMDVEILKSILFSLENNNDDDAN